MVCASQRVTDSDKQLFDVKIECRCTVLHTVPYRVGDKYRSKRVWSVTSKPREFKHVFATFLHAALVEINFLKKKFNFLVNFSCFGIIIFRCRLIWISGRGETGDKTRVTLETYDCHIITLSHTITRSNYHTPSNVITLYHTLPHAITLYHTFKHNHTPSHLNTLSHT